jgi:hypothetical protein
VPKLSKQLVLVDERLEHHCADNGIETRCLTETVFRQGAKPVTAALMILPVSSTMQTLVSLTDTSSPAKWSKLRFSF